MAWDLDICGDEAISMPALDKCDECEAFAERLDQLEDRVDAEPNYVPGDNISFEVQPDGTTKISAAGGTGGDYTAGDGIQISPANVISADVRRPMISDAETSPATDPHAVGEYLIYNNTLYRVKTAIAVGDALVDGANIEATSIAGEIKALNTVETFVVTPVASVVGFNYTAFKIGKLCILSLRFVGGSFPNVTEFARITNTKYRPKTQVSFGGVGTYSSYSDPMIYTITTGGDIRQATSPSPITGGAFTIVYECA